MYLTGQKAPSTRGQSGPQRKTTNRRHVNTVSAEPIQNEYDSSKNKLITDTGASINIIDEIMFEKIKQTHAM